MFEYVLASSLDEKPLKSFKLTVERESLKNQDSEWDGRGHPESRCFPKWLRNGFSKIISASVIY